jgi:hypothetical protein
VDEILPLNRIAGRLLELAADEAKRGPRDSA